MENQEIRLKTNLKGLTLLVEGLKALSDSTRIEEFEDQMEILELLDELQELKFMVKSDWY